MRARDVKKISIKKFMPRTLFARSLLILIVPVLLIQMITGFVFFDRHWSKVTTRLAYAVAGEVSILSEALERGGDDALIADAERLLELRVNYRDGALLDNVQRSQPSFIWENMVVRTFSRELASSLGLPFMLDIDFRKKLVQVRVQLEGGVLDVFLPQRRLFSSSGYIFLLWVMGASLVLLVIAILFMRNQIRPIKKLAVAAERFGQGRDVVAFKPRGATEVRMAAEAFLNMHKRIKRQIEQRTTMLAGVSHDLRTPLTRLKLQIAMLGDSPDVDAMNGDIQEMEKMIEGYLDFVRGDGDEGATLVSLNMLIDKIVVSAKRQGLEISSVVDGDINMTVRAMAFERCLGNLVSNAGKYAQHVWLSASVDKQRRLTLIVEDDGPGIPEDQYEDVFRPFYRVDTSRSAETGGVGLGLPIAMDVVHSHGGKIWLDKSRYGGLKVVISLPL